MPPIEAVTFDLGDTITDLGEGLASYAGRGLTRAGRVYDLAAAAGLALDSRERFCAGLADAIEAQYAEAVSRQAGLTLQPVLARFFAASGLRVDDAWLALAVDTWCAPGPSSAPLRLGARETLAALRDRGLRLGVISNTIQPGRFLDANLERSGLRGLFAATVYSSEAGVAKPHPAIFAAALAALGVEPGRAVHVGDRLPNDIAGAQAVGMRAVLIEVPQRIESDPHIRPDARIRELPELLAALAALEAGEV